jgi:hypothetical protein
MPRITTARPVSWSPNWIPGWVERARELNPLHTKHRFAGNPRIQIFSATPPPGENPGPVQSASTASPQGRNPTAHAEGLGKEKQADEAPTGRDDRRPRPTKTQTPASLRAIRVGPRWGFSNRLGNPSPRASSASLTLPRAIECRRASGCGRLRNARVPRVLPVLPVFDRKRMFFYSRRVIQRAFLQKPGLPESETFCASQPRHHCQRSPGATGERESCLFEKGHLLPEW